MLRVRTKRYESSCAGSRMHVSDPLMCLSVNNLRIKYKLYFYARERVIRLRTNQDIYIFLLYFHTAYHKSLEDLPQDSREYRRLILRIRYDTDVYRYRGFLFFSRSTASTIYINILLFSAVGECDRSDAKRK